MTVGLVNLLFTICVTLEQASFSFALGLACVCELGSIAALILTVGSTAVKSVELLQIVLLEHSYGLLGQELLVLGDLSRVEHFQGVLAV